MHLSCCASIGGTAFLPAKAHRERETRGTVNVLRSRRDTSPMSKKLIIAEKPSVANDIARVLGGFTRHGDYYESKAYVLSSAIGHLLELVPPEGVEVKRGKWSFAHLPVIPPHFDLKPIERTEERLKLLVK